MKEWSNPTMWKINSRYTQGGNDGSTGDNIAYQGPDGKMSGFNSGVSYSDIPGYTPIKK